MQDTRLAGSSPSRTQETDGASIRMQPHVEVGFGDVDSSPALVEHVHERAGNLLRRLHWNITRLEVHFTDESSSSKRTPNDKRCTMEARPAGKQPIAVEARADDWFAAVDAATGKLRRALERRLHRQAA